jgi:hypothetical protein
MYEYTVQYRMSLAAVTPTILAGKCAKKAEHTEAIRKHGVRVTEACKRSRALQNV